MQLIQLERQAPDHIVDQLQGKFLDDSHYDLVVNDDCDVIKPNGEVLIKYRAGRITVRDCDFAYQLLRKAAIPTNNRGLAGGPVDLAKIRRDPNAVGQISGTRYRAKRPDGSLLRTNYANYVNSGIAGFMDRSMRFPYCRTTMFNIDNPGVLPNAVPFIKQVDDVFNSEFHDRWERQRAAVEATNPDWTINGTAFTTLTINSNFQTAVHKDEGDLREGFGVMMALRSGEYTGGLTVFPKYRVAVDMRHGDVLMADVHEWHGNTVLAGETGRYERLSLVFYYREGMRECGTRNEEEERAAEFKRTKRRKR